MVMHWHKTTIIHLVLYAFQVNSDPRIRSYIRTQFNFCRFLFPWWSLTKKDFTISKQIISSILMLFYVEFYFFHLFSGDPRAQPISSHHIEIQSNDAHQPIPIEWRIRIFYAVIHLLMCHLIILMLFGLILMLLNFPVNICVASLTFSPNASGWRRRHCRLRVTFVCLFVLGEFMCECENCIEGSRGRIKSIVVTKESQTNT